ncbi:19649_t:CDS:2 [Gigaspora margarita]|uniref:19649_t:CDS:1 n=1 Tax=Gigaspora margarita TaxID=4874 RepID=A0ABN7WI71_GIGMA|nr:19649_t:CDS:2 [Gigaspora margarita]
METAEKSFIELLKLNYGLYYDSGNFIPSRPIVDDGQLDIKEYTRDILIYRQIQEVSNASEANPWEIFANAFSALTGKSQRLTQKSNYDIKILIPVLDVTYIVIKNVSEHSDNSLEKLKARIMWAVNERIQVCLLFEDLNGNSLDDMESLCVYLKQLYNFEIISVIAYEKVKPTYACVDAKKSQDVNASFDVSKSWPDYFDKLLVPGISIDYEELSMGDWLGNNMYMEVPLWIEQHRLDHGLVINSMGIIPSVKSAIKLTMEPSYELIGSTKMNLLDNIPFVNSAFDVSPINAVQCNIICKKVQVTFVEDTIKLSEQFEAAIGKALEKENPYEDLETAFIEYGHVFCLNFVMGERLTKLNGLEQEILKVPNRFEDITSCHDIFKEWKNFLNEHDKDSSSFYLSGDSHINIDDINDIDHQLNAVTENPNLWKVIDRLQFIPLYKLLKYDLQKEIEILLCNKERVLMVGMSKLKDSKSRYCDVNFQMQLKSDNYQITGSVVSNHSKKLDLNLRFQMLTVSGFSIIIEELHNEHIENDSDLTIYWQLIGKPQTINYFSKQTRNTQVLTGSTDFILTNKEVYLIDIDIKGKVDNKFELPLSSNCILATSFNFPPSNFNPKFEVVIIFW